MLVVKISWPALLCGICRFGIRGFVAQAVRYGYECGFARGRLTALSGGPDGRVGTAPWNDTDRKALS